MSNPNLCAACGHARTLHDGPEGVCVGNCTSLEPLVQCGCRRFLASEYSRAAFERDSKGQTGDDIAERRQAQPKAEPLHQRAWDLLRQMRSELLDDSLISREEYAWLAAEAPYVTSGDASQPGQGSPAPRRLERYDEQLIRLTVLEQERDELAAASRRENARLTERADLADEEFLAQGAKLVEAEARLTALEAENTRLRMRAALKTQNAEQATSRIATLEAENARLLDALTAHAARTIMDALKIPL